MEAFNPTPEPKEGSAEKKRPDLSGDVQKVDVQADGTKQYTKVGHLALWTNDRKEGKQPDMRGTISPPKGMDGPTFAISVWKNREASK